VPRCAPVVTAVANHDVRDSAGGTESSSGQMRTSASVQACHDGWRLRNALQRDDREVPAPAEVVDAESDLSSGLAANERLWCGTGRAAWPAGARLEAR
jgi:hypothetical protein